MSQVLEKEPSVEHLELPPDISVKIKCLFCSLSLITEVVSSCTFMAVFF